MLISLFLIFSNEKFKYWYVSKLLALAVWMILNSFDVYLAVTTKTKNSNDNVDLPTKVCDDLVAMKNAYNPKGTDYIFFIQNTSRTTVRRKFTYFQNKAGLPHIKFHGLRHSIASRMINQGINPLFVSKHLRHSNPSITLSTYSHMFGKITAGLMDNL